MANEQQEAEFGRLVDSMVSSQKLGTQQRDSLRFDVSTALLPLIASVQKQVFAKRQQELEGCLVTAITQTGGTALQRSLTGCLVAMYKSGRSYTSQATFGSLEDAISKLGSNKEACRANILESMGSLVSIL